MPEHLRAFVFLAFWGHARLGEILGLRRGDFDIGAGTLRIERQIVEVNERGPVETACKYGSLRTVHLSLPAAEILSRHLRTNGPALPSARIFTRPDGNPLRAHHIHAAWKTAVKRTDLAGVHVRDLRHAGLTLVAQAGATVAELMRRGGHSSTKAALLYQHAAEHRDAEVAQRMTALANIAEENPVAHIIPTSRAVNSALRELPARLRHQQKRRPLGP
jgi:integrase